MSNFDLSFASRIDSSGVRCSRQCLCVICRQHLSATKIICNWKLQQHQHSFGAHRRLSACVQIRDFWDQCERTTTKEREQRPLFATTTATTFFSSTKKFIDVRYCSSVWPLLIAIDISICVAVIRNLSFATRKLSHGKPRGEKTMSLFLPFGSVIHSFDFILLLVAQQRMSSIGCNNNIQWVQDNEMQWSYFTLFSLVHSTRWQRRTAVSYLWTFYCLYADAYATLGPLFSISKTRKLRTNEMKCVENRLNCNSTSDQSKKNDE